MTNALRKSLPLLPAIVAYLLCSTVSGQEKPFVCHKQESLWRDARGEPVRLSVTQLKKRRIHCEAPKLPGQWCGRGKIMYQVNVGANS